MVATHPMAESTTRMTFSFLQENVSLGPVWEYSATARVFRHSAPGLDGYIAGEPCHELDKSCISTPCRAKRLDIYTAEGEISSPSPSLLIFFVEKKTERKTLHLRPAE